MRSSSTARPANYATFETENFTRAEQASTAISGALADPDADGLSNLQEYAFNLDPRTPDRVGKPSGGVADGYLILTYRQAKAAADVTFTVEVSGDLATWQSGPASTTQVSAVDLDANTRQVTVRDNVPTGSAAQRFMRLKVSAP